MPRSEKPKPVRGLQTPVPDANRVQAIQSLLVQLYPETTTALQFETPFQLAIATILSAQCTDKRVNLVTPVLFARFPDAAALAHADMEEIQKLIQSTGFFRAKARNIQACAQKILDQHAGKLPETLEELIALPGIGRKTANVVLGDAFGVPGITVDTHVGRLSRRLALSVHTDPVKVEKDLMRWIPQGEWTRFSHRLIFHGRQVCHARKPLCSECLLTDHCPKIGVEPSKALTRQSKPAPQTSAPRKPVRRAKPRHPEGQPPHA